MKHLADTDSKEIYNEKVNMLIKSTYKKFQVKLQEELENKFAEGSIE